MKLPLKLNVTCTFTGTAKDYKEHITTSIEAVSSAYAATVADCDPEEVKRTICDHIKCTISDRAAVNKCVTESLGATFEKELTMLNCNVHPLEAMARGIQKVVQHLEKVRSTKYIL